MACKITDQQPPSPCTTNTLLTPKQPKVFKKIGQKKVREISNGNNFLIERKKQNDKIKECDL